MAPCVTDGYGYEQAKNTKFFYFSVQFLSMYQCDFRGAKLTRQSPACLSHHIALSGCFLVVPHTQWISFWFCPCWAFWFAWREPEQTPPVTAGHRMSLQTKHTLCRSRLCFSWSNSLKAVRQLLNRMQIQYMDCSLFSDTIESINILEPIFSLMELWHFLMYSEI